METTLLNGLGRFSVGLALLAMLGVIVDPILLMVSFVALILGGFFAIAGKLRYVAIVGGIVAASILIAFMAFPSASAASLSGLLWPGLRMMAPPYLVAVALAAFGRWRLCRAAPSGAE
ncbi:MAG: hypothetical protein WC091_11545 [Sulfuricellaceae bacterium]